MVIIDPFGITFTAVGAFGLDCQLLFKSGLSYRSFVVLLLFLTSMPVVTLFDLVFDSDDDDLYVCLFPVSLLVSVL